MLTRQLLLCFGAAVVTTWLTEHLSFWIAHAVEGMLLVLVASPGMIPVFFGPFTNEIAAWSFAIALTTLYYFAIWAGIRKLKAKDQAISVGKKTS